MFCCATSRIATKLLISNVQEIIEGGVGVCIIINVRVFLHSHLKNILEDLLSTNE